MKNKLMLCALSLFTTFIDTNLFGDDDFDQRRDLVNEQNRNADIKRDELNRQQELNDIRHDDALRDQQRFDQNRRMRQQEENNNDK